MNKKLIKAIFEAGVPTSITPEYLGQLFINETDGGIYKAIGTSAGNWEQLASLISPSFTTPNLGTPSAGTLTNCTGLPISGLVSSTSTALGVGSIELGHASDTTITRVSAGVIAVEGSNILTALTGAAIGQTFYIGTTQVAINRTSGALTLAGITLTTPNIGTPSAGTLTNCSGLPISGLVASTSTAIGVGSIELGHASDTSITRVSAGQIAVEGVNVLMSGGALGTPSSGTLTNCTFPTLNQNTTGSANSLKSPTTTGLAQLSGMAAGSTRVYTVPDADATLLYSGGALGTPSSGTLTNCTFPTLNQDTTGSAVYWKTAGTGKAAITGPAAGSTRTYTFPDANATILYSGGALGTPSSGTVTNLTGTASININGTVGATTPTTGVFTTITANTGIVPDANDGAYLGTTALSFSDLFLASGAVINFANSNVTLTHSTGVLTLAGTLALGTNSITMTGSIGATGARVTKGWFTDLEITNTPTINGTAMSSIYAAIAQTMYIGTTAVAINRGSGALTLAGITLTTPNIGTPSAGTLTNCSGLPISGLVSSTSTALGVGSIELGHASDTTISRVSAGIIAVEGKNVYLAGGTDVSPADGGTGVSNGTNNTITFTGNYSLGLTLSATTSVTLPTSGTLMANLVEDTTPQLGGELDCQAHSIGFTQQTATGDGTTTIDWKLGNKFYFTFGNANETFTFTAPSKPCNLLLVLKQYSTGGKTVTWPNSVMWPGGIAPTLSTGNNAIDIVSFYFDGTNYFGNVSLNFSVPA